ncbi:type II toxin-antitoxin system VapC family toxin [Actinomyces trachealis]|uniref:type II toxin-antitoxin system VapC family toxin n=1 Tax=Actinomyces trachealis TaxID=2763540 RepID=UPI001892B875|nr:type II toxin-antitoxin system VapC family toxin [Actinomyces trachealis]
MIILDTNVILEPLRRSPDPAVARWLDDQAQSSLYLTALTVAELCTGVEMLPGERRRDNLRQRLENDVFPFFADRVLPFNLAATQAWAEIQTEARRRGRPLPVMDSLIASIARVHGFALATRNIKDLESTGVTLINPWTD